MKKLLNIDYKGQLLLKGSTDNFGHVWLICRSYFAEHNCCLQFISIYDSIQDNNQKMQNFLKITNFRAAIQQRFVGFV